MRTYVCPICRATMSASQVGPAGLHFCAACRGAFFTRQNLEATFRQGAAGFRLLINLFNGVSQPVDSVNMRTCPHCEAVLRVVEYPSVPGARLGACGFCSGFWLDRPAVEAILRRLTAPTPEAPPPTEVTRPQPRSWEWGNTNPSPPPGAAPAPSNPLSAMASPPPAAAPPASAGASVRRAPPTPAGESAPRPPGARPGTRERTPGAGPTTGPVGNRKGRAGVPERDCPKCHQPNSEQAAVCWACGYLFKGQVVGNCPHCAGFFHRFESDGIPVDYCDGCGGTWLERGRLSALAFQDRALKDEVLRHQAEVATGRIRKLEDPFLCPGCGLIMFPHPIGTLTQQPIHTCVQCQATFVLPEALVEALSH